ncbi:MAG: protein-L-isoaspartate(D-aspartate) O-methyltransferase [Acidiferrobacteraceae bacterium]
MSARGIGMTSHRTRERLITRLRAEGILDARVLRAMTEVPRHLFVDEALASRAYEDTALPIGHGQTISQPYIVARMTELVLKGAPKSVLEIGTGSGYQTAVLARLVEQVYSIERVAALFQRARRRLSEQGFRNVTTRLGDGGLGWLEHAPFDAILVTAGAGDVPDALRAQLASGGRIIIPVGYERQMLTVIRGLESGREAELIEAVSFVPLLNGVE